MDFANAFALTGWLVLWFIGGVIYSFGNAVLLLKDGYFQAAWVALFGMAAIGSFCASVVLGHFVRSWKLAAVLLPLGVSFVFVFVSSLLAGNGASSNVQAMDADAIRRVDMIAGGIELATLVMLAWVLRPHWGATAALAVFCATFWLSAMTFSTVLLSHQML